MTEELREEVEGGREEDEKAGLVEEQRVSLEEGGLGLEEGLDLRRVGEVKGHLGVMAVAALGIDRDRPQNQGLQPQREVGVETRGGFRVAKDRRLVSLDFSVRK